MDLYEVLDNLQIFYQEVRHPKVCTVLEMQKLHKNGRKDIFKRTTKKDVKKEFLELLNENKKQTIVVADDKNKVRGLSYCIC